MTLRLMKMFGRAALDSRVILTALSLVLVANASTLFAQNDGSATMRAIKPFIGFEETFQWSAVPEIVRGAAEGQSEEDYAWSSDLFFEKEIWQLKFSYKNVRTVDVDFPTEDGKLETKRVWYLVYSVTNDGQRLRAVLDDTIASDVSMRVVDPSSGKPKKFEFPSNNLKGVYRPEKFESKEAILFAPRFVLASANIQEKLEYERNPENGLFFGSKKGASADFYYDEYMPLAIAEISKREAREGQTLIDSVRMANRTIKPGETVWGVATWVDVDPRIDRFSIYISGLTNALRWEFSENETEESARVGEGRDILRKVLKLNFINPGDEAHSGKEIYNYLPGELDYQWIYM